MEKVIRDGKVAVLLSGEWGAAWSTWFSELSSSVNSVTTTQRTNNMNTEWITDRLPTNKDANYYGHVWGCSTCGNVFILDYDMVMKGEPWMKITPPEPYVKPEPERWMPEIKESYWTIDGMSVIETNWDNDIIDEARLAIGNCFKERWHADECFESFVDILSDYNEGLYNE
jgi:hypothetical protein